MPGEIIYEPRALWSVKRALPVREGLPRVVRFDREHFRNGWRHPVTLTKLLIAPVGYTFTELKGISSGPTDRHQAAAVLQAVKLFVKSPGRQLFTLDNLLTGAFSPLPVAGAGMSTSRSHPWASSMLGNLRWDFDKPVELPTDYAVDFRLGGLLAQPAGGVGPPPTISVSFFETGVGTGQPGTGFAANVRSHREELLWHDADSQGHPFQPDEFGAMKTLPSGGTYHQWPWRFTPGEYRRRQHARSGPTRLNSISVAFDQIGYDDAFGFAPGSPYAEIAPLALRTASSCRVVDAGSQAQWWRDGAPLALVMPSLTPAQVYELDRPITLHKGDTLDVELEIPGGVFDLDEGLILPPYQIGVSFTGYAAVEG